MNVLWGEDQTALLQACLDELDSWQQQWPVKRAFLLVPEHRKLEAEQAFLRRYPDRALLLADVTSFTRLTHALGASLTFAGEQRLDAMGERLLLSALLHEHREDLPQLAALAKRPGYLQEMVILLGDFRRLGLSDEQIKQTVSQLASHWVERPKFEELALLLGYYSQALAKRRLVDQAQRMERLVLRLEALARCVQTHQAPETWSAELKPLQFLTHTWIWVTGFAETRLFTPQEWRILMALDQVCERLTLTCLADQVPAQNRPLSVWQTHLPYGTQTLSALQQKSVLSQLVHVQSAPPHVQRVGVSVSSPQEEAKLCAAELFRLHQSAHGDLKWQDFAVVVTPKASVTALASALEALQIPAHLDQRLSLANAPFIRYLLSFLQLDASGWSRDAVLTFLRSGLTPLSADEIDALENFWLERGMDHQTLFAAHRYSAEWAGVGQRLAQPASAPQPLESFDEIPDEGFIADEGVALSEPLPPSSSGLASTRAEWLAQRAKRCLASRQRALDPVRAFYAALPAKMTAKQWVQAIRSWLKQAEIQNRLGLILSQSADRPESELRLYSQSWNVALEALAQIETLLGETPCEALTLREILFETVHRAYAETLPAYVDQVQVGPLDALLTRRYRVVYVLGGSAEVFPLPAGREGLLREEERKAWNAVADQPLPVLVERERDQRRVLEQLVLRMASDRLYISRAGEARPASLLNPKLSLPGEGQPLPLLQLECPALPQDRMDVRSLLPDYRWLEADQRAETTGVADEPLALMPQAYRSAQTQGLSMQTVAALLPSHWTLTQLEQYRRCPYAYLVQGLLRAKPRRIWQPDQLNLGSLLHGVLQQEQELIQAQLTHLDPADWPAWLEQEAKREADPLDHYLNGLIDQVIESQSEQGLGVFREQSVVRRQTREARNRLKQNRRTFLASWLSPELNKVPADGERLNPYLVPYEAEVPLAWRQPLPQGGEIALVGRIDRVDRSLDPAQRWVRVIDYKTGVRKVSTERLQAGLDLQLPLYLAGYLACHRDQPLLAEDGGYRSLTPVIRNPSRMKKSVRDQAYQAVLDRAAQQETKQVLNRDLPPKQDLKSLVQAGDFESMEAILQTSLEQVGVTVEQLGLGQTAPKPCWVEASAPPCQYCDKRALCAIPNPYQVGHRIPKNPAKTKAAQQAAKVPQSPQP